MLLLLQERLKLRVVGRDRAPEADQVSVGRLLLRRVVGRARESARRPRVFESAHARAAAHHPVLLAVLAVRRRVAFVRPVVSVHPLGGVARHALRPVGARPGGVLADGDEPERSGLEPEAGAVLFGRVAPRPPPLPPRARPPRGRLLPLLLLRQPLARPRRVGGGVLPAHADHGRLWLAVEIVRVPPWLRRVGAARLVAELPVLLVGDLVLVYVVGGHSHLVLRPLVRAVPVVAHR